MGRNNRNSEIIFEDMTILDIAAEGMAIGRVDNLVVFVPYGIVGDIVDVKVIKKRKNYCEGKIINFKKYSTLRVEPQCSHFGLCGGCKWQSLNYEDQLKYKRDQVEDNFKRLGNFNMPEVANTIASDNRYFYRNKLEFSFSDKKWFINKSDFDDAEIKCGLGFHLPGMFDKILDIEKCWLQSDPSNQIRLAIKNFAIEQNWTFWNARSQVGFMRNIIIRTSSTTDVMLIVVFGEDDKEKIEKMMTFIKASFPEITSLFYIINLKPNDSIADLKPKLYNGVPYITEQMEDLRFEVGPLSFYQTNSLQAYKLYCTVREFAELTDKETVYDLYTGTGTIANFIARKAKKVIGIEYVEDAIKDAVRNSKTNGITNTVFFAGDMSEVLNENFIKNNGHPDIIITDPPRAGMHEKVIGQILKAEPERIVYVSCNPATQARDITMLDNKYTVEKIQPVDMFPHTHHVENVVLLKRR